MPKFGTEQEEVMREKTMKKGHLLLTLLAFVCLMGLGTIHANAATVKAKVDVKKFYGIAEQVLQEINKERRSNGLQDLKMDATLTEAAMNIALQEQGGNATVSNPEIYNDKYTIKGAFKLGDIDGYDEYEDNLWKETTKGKRAITKHVSELGKFLYKDSNISSTIGIGIVATDNPKNIPRELNNGSRYNVTYCFVSNWIAYDSTSYDIYKNNGKTVRTQMDLYIDSSNTYLIVDADKNELTPKYAYDVIKKGEKRKAHPGVWENIPVTGAKRFLCKLSNDGASWSSSNPSIVSVDANGNITAKKNGIATVTVRVGSLQATKKYVVSDIISVDTDTLLSLPNWKSKSDIPKEYTGNCYAGGYALEVKNGRITWSKNMKTNKKELLDSFKGGLIVSCQVQHDDPTFSVDFVVKMAKAAQWGGAVGIRANDPEQIKAIKKEVDLPVIGLWKIWHDDTDVFITPTLEAAKAVWEAGAEIIALDCTSQITHEGRPAYELLPIVKKEIPEAIIFADVSNYEEAVRAVEMGADIVGPTLYGYTEATKHIEQPDLREFARMCRDFKDKAYVIMEGHIYSPEDAMKCIFLGAHSVVVGSAITRPHLITKRFTDLLTGYQNNWREAERSKH